jgi:PAS domain S-box-containing protein
MSAGASRAERSKADHLSPQPEASSSGAAPRAPASPPPDEAERLKDFAALASDWFWEIDSSLRFTYLSDRFEAVTGVAAENALGRTLLEVARADLRERHWQQHLEDMLAIRAFRDFTFTASFGLGEPRLFRVNGAPFFDAQGRFQGFRGCGSDITERERDHERLAAVKGRLEHLVHTSPAMIYSFKASGDYAATFASDNIRRQLGHEPSAFLKDPRFWSDHIHPDDLPRVLHELGLLFKNGHHVQEYRFRHRNGGYRWMRDELVLVKDDNGQPLEVVGYWVDITDRKRAEETVKAYAERLERSNRELQDFAYVASHDLQEPLRKIEAFGDRLRAKCADVLSDDGRMYLERMQSAASRMRGLINDLLTYSRVTTKAQPFAPTDLNAVLEGVVSDLHVAIERSGAQIEVGRLPTIDADATQMRQLLQNLIGNALKFRKADVPPVVGIAGERVTDARNASSIDDADGNWCRLTVTDNGIGFDQKYADRIFNMFERLHGRGEYEGTGIGLATCRKIVERHGGKIEARSVPGEGSTFVVSLPARQIREETSNEPGSGVS